MRQREQEPILSVHIEKSGGTSLEAWWIQMFGPGKVMIYNPDTDRLLSAKGLSGKKANPTINRMREFIRTTPAYPFIQRVLISYLKNHEEQLRPEDITPNIKVVHGHFSADRFDSILPEARLTVVLRDPLERMISHYNHWLNAQGEMTHRVRVPFDQAMPFTQFALLPQLKNYQAQALGGKPLSDFWVYGTTEKLNEFLMRVVESGNFGHLVPKKNQAMQLNKSLKRHNFQELGITPQFYSAFEQHHHHDYTLYSLAEQR